MRISTLSVAALVACAGGKDGLDGTRATVCLEVSDVVDFGEHAVGEGALVGAVQVANTCDHEVELRDATTTPPFAVSTPFPLTVGKGLTTSLVVTFEPDDHRDYDAELSLLSSDGGGVVDLTALHGTGLAPEALVEGALELRAAPGCDDAASLTIRNIGNVDLEVYDVGLPDPAITLTPLPPYTVSPDGAVELDVLFGALDTVDLVGSLVLSTNDPFTPDVTVPLTASSYATTHEERFAADRSRVDVLFAVDRSCSNRDDVVRLLGDATPLVDELRVTGLDARLAVVTNDDRCVVGDDPFVDLGADDVEARFAEMISSDGVLDENLAEQGFEMAVTALWSPCNAGLMRDGARLVVVHVADEDDQSESISVEDYVNTLALTALSEEARVHTVTGPYPAGCGAADPGVRFHEAAVASYGQEHSICAEDPERLQRDIADGLVEPDRTYRLAYPAAEASIEVRVAGALQDPATWSFDEAANAVVLTWTPTVEAPVDIRYVERGGC